MTASTTEGNGKTEHGPHCDDWTEGDSPTPDPTKCQTCAFVRARQETTASQVTWWSLDDWEDDLNLPAYVTLAGKRAAIPPGNGDWTRDKEEALAVWASRGYDADTGLARAPNRVPDSKSAETVLGLAKAVASAVPVLGGLAAGLMEVVIGPQIERRRTDWLNSLAECLAELEERIDRFRVADLVDDPAFTSAMLQAGAIALRNHNDEKLAALRNAVLNVAVSSTPVEDEQELFISLIGTFTRWHLRILAFLADKHGVADKRGELPFPNWYMGGVATVLEHVYPELEGRRALYDLIVSDLHRAGLAAVDGLHTTGTRDGYMLAKQSSEMGDRFLAFITEPDRT